MSDIVAVLVVPADGDPGGLLRGADGSDRDRCGARPPSVGLYADRWYGWPGPDGWKVRCDGLPLWWDGAVVPDGWDRARRASFEAGRASVGAVQLFDPRLSDVLHIASGLVVGGMASRVVRFVQVDGCLVEVE